MPPTPHFIRAVQEAATSTSSSSSSGASASSTPDPNAGKQSPILYFVALGFGVVFANLWVIIGIRYCCRNRRLRQLNGSSSPQDVAIQAVGSSSRSKQNTVVSKDQVDVWFPSMTYKQYIHAKGDEGESTTETPATPATGDVADQPLSKSDDKDDTDKDDTEIDGVDAGIGPVDAPDFASAKPGADQTSCIICFEEFVDNMDVRVLACKHVYCADCIMTWLTTQYSWCPLCKLDVSKAKPAVATTTTAVAEAPAPTPTVVVVDIADASTLAPPSSVHHRDRRSSSNFELSDMSRSPSLSAASINAVAHAHV